MPRDAAETRGRLVASGRALFAVHGAFTTPLSKVIEHAGQKNVSALHYHFGGREGLIAAIIDEHNTGIEERRKTFLDAIGASSTITELVESIVLPQATLLDEEHGRSFLSIVSQLRDRFGKWDDGSTPQEALRSLVLLREALNDELAPNIAHERITRFLEMTSEALGSRARQIARGETLLITNSEFVSNLTAMAAGALASPST